jgi:hypothetical protein
VTGDCGAENIQSPVRFTGAGCRLPLLNHTSLWLGAWMPTPRTRTAHSAACLCSYVAQFQTIRVPCSRVSTANGAASCSTSHRGPRFWNSPRRRSRRAKFLPSPSGVLPQPKVLTAFAARRATLFARHPVSRALRQWRPGSVRGARLDSIRIRIAPSRTRTGQRLVLRVGITGSANAADGSPALLEGGEAAVR